MAGKQIELEFSVADGGSKILEDLKHVKSIADGNDAYTGLNYRLSPQSRNALENDLKTIQKSVEKANTASGSSVNMSALQKEVAARRQITNETEKTIAAAKQMQQATEATAKATQDSAKAKKNDTAESTRMMNIEMQMGNYAKKYGDNISKNITLQAKFNDLMGKVQRGDIGAQEAAKEWAEYRLECRKAGVEVETLGQKLNKLFGESFKQRAKFLISTSALAAARQAVRDIKEIDSAMTELRKVTDETADTYNKFMVNAGSRAKDIGATMSDVIKSTADFARLGYDIKDASKLADAAIVLKNVGDGITDIDDASEKIISVVKAFPEFEGNAMSVVDKMNEVGNNYAISSSGIAEALQRSAGALTAANNTLDESIALAVGMNAVTQDPAKVGTSLKTLTMYLRASKTEAEAAGESTDGMAESVSKLRDEILALTGQKVDILQDNGDYKSTIQIMRELAAVWDKLSDVSQANILERIGGKRNASVISSLLQNFDDVEAALKTAQAAEGSALRENEKYLDSIQGRLDVLKATGQSIASTVLQDNGVKHLMDMIQGAANAVDKLVNSLGALPTALLGGGLFAAFKNLD